ncbi:RHS domain-containing protein [Proteus mirabilis]|nr:RHS domain-containing protein [Proteus mirabilis]EKW4662758.1 RHS domain-containing protein [Proteus mirabilis]EKW9419883.1 RHS domain-containing protein [Proteus mirabilis]ELB1686679.1 RHS domain-containing protein [Proteus mirabilis]UTA59135.1 RHS domain-containing protein [Proteus mirabilis]UTA65768.1 RHS domain-containing protein [Proteus mirabilis]
MKQSSGFHYYWHHCDINSAPLEVTNAQGNTLWSGNMNALALFAIAH